MICMYCGNDIPKDSAFCPGCGNAVIVPQPQIYDHNTGQSGFQENIQWENAPVYEGRSQQQDQDIYRTEDSGMLMKVFSGVMCAIFMWFFIKNFFPAGYYMLLNIFYGSRLLIFLLSMLLGASYGVMAIVMFVLFEKWSPGRRRQFGLSICMSGILIILCGVLKLLALRSGYYYIDYTWFVWLLVMTIASIGGYFVIHLITGIDISIIDDNYSFQANFTDSASYIADEFIMKIDSITSEVESKNESRQLSQPKKPLKTDYSLAAYIFLGIFTLGIYPLYIFHCVARDVNKTCQGDGKRTNGLILFLLFNLITLGIYSWFYYVKLGNRMKNNASRYNVYVQETGWTILLWSTFGVLLFGIGPFIAEYIILKNTNALNMAYNSVNFNYANTGMYPTINNIQINNYTTEGNSDPTGNDR